MKAVFQFGVFACIMFPVLTSTGLSGQKQKEQTDPDAVFFKKVLNSSMAEIQLGKLAMDRSSNDNVKKFAKRMIEDHKKAIKELVAISDKQNTPPIKETSKEQKEGLDKLGQKQGADFDSAYMNNQVKAHEEAVALFKKEANSGKNENFKAYASKMLPTLEAHLKMARAIADKLGTAK